VVLRGEQDDVARPAGEGVAEIMETTVDDPIAVGAVAAPPTVVADTDADLGLGQGLEWIEAESRLRARFAGSWHGVSPERMLVPGDTLGDGRMFIIPARFPCYRLPPAPTTGSHPQQPRQCSCRNASWGWSGCSRRGRGWGTPPPVRRSHRIPPL